MIDENDIEWARVTHAVTVELAQSIVDRHGSLPLTGLKQRLEALIGAPWSRTVLIFSRETKRVVDVEVLSAERALGVALSLNSRPRAYC